MKDGWWCNYQTGQLVEINEHEEDIRNPSIAKSLGVPAVVFEEFKKYKVARDRVKFLTWLLKTVPLMRIRAHGIHVVRKDPRIGSGTGIDGVCQVVLFNDNVHSFDQVIDSLITVFGHSLSVAEKVTMEAHHKGKAIAEVEEYEKAVVHKGMLNNRGFAAEVERI